MEYVELAVLLGDGIGPDVVKSTMDVLEQAGRNRDVDIEFSILPSGLAALETHGGTLPDSTIEQLPSYAGWILGPVTHHLYLQNDKRYINPSGYLRKQFNLYANVRPSRSFEGVPKQYSEVDLVIVRENTEGFYADRNVLDGNGEFRPDEDTVISLRVVSRQACMRVAQQAFLLARQRAAKSKVTMIHKANVLRLGDGLFLECCYEVAEDYPEIFVEDFHVDAFAMHLVTRPQDFDVVVTTNMFGDILSDEAAGLVGGLGIAPGLNVGNDHAMAQAVHGSAPDIEHRHIANPVSEILSGKLLMEWLSAERSSPELGSVANDVERAVSRTLADGRVMTQDLGGSANTAEMTQAILDNLERFAK